MMLFGRLMVVYSVMNCDALSQIDLNIEMYPSYCNACRTVPHSQALVSCSIFIHIHVLDYNTDQDKEKPITATPLSQSSTHNSASNSPLETYLHVLVVANPSSCHLPGRHSYRVGPNPNFPRV